MCSPGYTTEPFVPSSTVMLDPHQSWDWHSLPSTGYTANAPYHQVANPQYSPSSAPAVTAPAATTLPPSLVSFFAFDGQAHHL